MLAYDYPILGLFWTMFIFFLWFAWIMLLFRVFVDLFRSDLSGWSKAFWSFFVIIVPFLGVLIYIVVHGSSMRQRDIADVQQREAAFRDYVVDVAATGGPADELSKLATLRDQGVLTEAEFDQQKAKVLGGTATAGPGTA